MPVFFGNFMKKAYKALKSFKKKFVTCSLLAVMGSENESLAAIVLNAVSATFLLVYF